MLPLITNGQLAMRNALNAIVPNWLSNRPLLNTGFKFLWSLAVIADCLIETCGEGFMAAFPGVGTNTALPYIGQARGLIQGPNEPNSSFITRLQNYLTAHNNQGSPQELVTQLQAYLTPKTGAFPTVRIVDRSGNWCSISPTQVISETVDATWNWDNTTYPWHSNGTQPKWWGDIWIIINPSSYSTFTSLSDANFIAAFENSGNGNGFDQMCGRQDVSNILQIVKDWRGGHNYVQAIIWCTDPAIFVPGSLSTTGNPTGIQGNWSTTVSGVRVPSRAVTTSGGTIRYWTPGYNA
jgi:hypothetical protein